jgi:hypothetical protein
MLNLPIDRSFKESGQALLIILLVMSVALTVVLSVIARSVTDIGISKSQDDSIRAFNAAEAGIEKALIGGVMTGHLESGADFNTIVSDAPRDNAFIYPVNLNAGESATFWFVSHTTDATTHEEKITCLGGLPCLRPTSKVNICWGEEGTPPNSDNTPAVLIEFFYDPTLPYIWDSNPNNFSAIRVLRETADPNQAGRTAASHFSVLSNGNCQIAGKNFAFHKSIFFSGGGSPNDGDIQIANWSSMNDGALIMVKVHMLFNNDKPQPVGLKDAGGKMPTQGKLIESTGVSAENYRKLSIFQGYPELPFAFNSVIFSGGNISK